MKSLFAKISVIRRFAVIALLVAAFSGTAYAEIPQGYYTSLNGKKDGELKTAIHDLVRNFTLVSSYSALPQYFFQTDVYPESNRWWDMYSDIPLYAPSFRGLNREHSFPKSWWGGLTTVSAYVDLNHLYPSEAAANMAKSNYPLGEVSTSANVKFDNGVTKVGYPVAGQGGGAAFVFEPDDEYKGDFARTYFYMATCYQNLKWKYTFMVNQNLYPTLTGWAVNLLMKWHRQDPVSEKETLRNDAVYRIQNNRNPFIDYPELAEYLWGDKKGMPFDAATAVTPGGTPNLITPVQDMVLDFGEVAIGKSVQARLFFNGENLSKPIELAVYKGNSKFFTIPTRTIAANLVNSSEGYWLTMTYTPDETGEHTSRLLISGGGISGSRGIELRGICQPVPTLTAPTATAATDIESNSYVANWVPVDGETVDYYLINRTMYANGTATFEQVVAENTGTVIEGFDAHDNEAYTVQSVRLGYVSPESNVVTVSHAGVTGIENDKPLATVGLEGMIRFMVSTPHTDVRIYDTMGRTVVTIDQVDNYTDITMAPGIYFVTTGQAHRPVRVIVR